jgi:PAS domain S-box-containing protein
MAPSQEFISDSTYQAQEELLFRTAARLKGVVFYRALSLILLPLAAWLSSPTLVAPAIFWAMLAVSLGIHLLNIAFSLSGAYPLVYPAAWFILADATGLTLLAGLSGGSESHFVYGYFLLILYSAIWFNRRLAFGTGILVASYTCGLAWLAAPSAGDHARLAVLIFGLLALAVGTGEIAQLVADTRERIVHAVMDLIAANKRVLAQQMALRQNEERLRLVLDTAAEGIFGVDIEGRCTFANRACATMLGYSGEAELLGQNMHQLAHHTHPDGHPYPEAACRVKLATRSGESSHCADDVHWRVDGSMFPVEFWSHPIQQDGQIVGAVISFIDISQRKQAEEALHRLNLELEDRVEQRTRELATSNTQLKETLD